MDDDVKLLDAVLDAQTDTAGAVYLSPQQRAAWLRLRERLTRRVPVQIAVAATDDKNGVIHSFYTAVGNDGSIWRRDVGGKWVRLPDLPQGGTHD